MDPTQVILWVQAGGKMVELVTTGISNLKTMLAQSGADEAAQNAALDRTHGLYQERIAREKQIGAGAVAPMLLLLLFATPAFAQVTVPHPTPPSWQFCWDYPADGPSVTVFRVFADGTQVGESLPPRQSASPNYCVPFPPLTPGTHELTVAGVNAAGQGPSSAPVLAALELRPFAPLNPVIRQVPPGD